MGIYKNTFKAPKGERWNKLSLIERGVYAVIACCSEFKTGKSNITREKIKKFTGIKSADLVTKYTDNLVALGFLKKTHRHINGKNVATYWVQDVKHFSLVKRDIVNSGLTGKQLGLYVTLAGLRFGNSNRIDIPSLYSKCGVSAHTYYKYLQELIDNDSIKSEDGVIQLNCYLPLNISDFSVRLLKEMGDCPQGSCAKRVYDKIMSGDIKDIANLDAYIQRGYCNFKKIDRSHLENIRNIYELC